MTTKPPPAEGRASIPWTRSGPSAVAANATIEKEELAANARRAAQRKRGGVIDLLPLKRTGLLLRLFIEQARGGVIGVFGWLLDLHLRAVLHNLPEGIVGDLGDDDLVALDAGHL